MDRTAQPEPRPKSDAAFLKQHLNGLKPLTNSSQSFPGRAMLREYCLLSGGSCILAVRRPIQPHRIKNSRELKMKSVSPALACLVGLSLAAWQPGQDVSTEEAAPQAAAVPAATPPAPAPRAAF